MCEERAAKSSGGGTNNPPIGLRSNWEPGEPTGDGNLNEAARQHVFPREGHVAKEPGPTAEAFWALLEQVGYTVW